VSKAVVGVGSWGGKRGGGCQQGEDVGRGERVGEGGIRMRDYSIRGSEERGVGMWGGKSLGPALETGYRARLLSLDRT